MALTLFTRLNPASGIPFHVQLARQVEQAVATGALLPGESLPGIRPLAARLVVHPSAVARAYEALALDGVVSITPDAGGAIVQSAAVHEPRRRTIDDLALENRRLSQEIAAEVAERIRRTRELHVATEVQRRLLPQERPAVLGVDYAGASRAALGVGGDYYDFVARSSNGLAITIADVAGKGTPAALLMAALRGYWRAVLDERVADLAEAIGNLNRLVCESSAANRYATFFAAEYDALTRRLTYVNAGHLPPFVFRTTNPGDALRLDPSGPVVGFLPDCSYAARSIQLECGDILLMVTDGITEANAGSDVEWGESRLAELIQSNSALPASDLVALVMSRVDDFVGSASQYDDMTVVAMRVS
ncbi:MAG TPA: SpoIIE family protein phosphatase [Vicinamibacterales bacterium]|jgi:sigma-B regulation protein RsbU (phosphoserine phosphatase)